MQEEDAELSLPKAGKQFGVYLIRDYLRFQLQNGLTKAFEADGTTFQNVAFCARITSVERTEDRTRLILDDGTSAILCVLNHSTALVDSEEEEDEAQNETCELGQLLQAQSRRLKPEKGATFSRTSLGSTVFVLGDLCQFNGRNFVFASSVRRVSEDYFVQFLDFTFRGVEFRRRHTDRERNINYR